MERPGADDGHLAEPDHRNQRPEPGESTLTDLKHLIFVYVCLSEKLEVR